MEQRAYWQFESPRAKEQDGRGRQEEAGGTTVTFELVFGILVGRRARSS